jgi:hypothetical protein
MISDLTAGIVRILNPNGETSGTGFVLTGEGLIATAPTSLKASGQGKTVRLVFHYAGNELTATVEPITKSHCQGSE